MENKQYTFSELNVELSCSILYTILIYQKKPSWKRFVLTIHGLNPLPSVLNDDNSNNDDDDADKVQYTIHDGNLSRYTMSQNAWVKRFENFLGGDNIFPV